LYKLLAFDLDGTLTQHKTPLDEEHRAELDRLACKYKLLMVGAGQCIRIFNQMTYPIDIIGNYGMQYAEYVSEIKNIRLVLDRQTPCDKEKAEELVTAFRQKHGFTRFSGENVEYHVSGCITIPILGTTAKQEDKLAFDPNRSKRRTIYQEVVEAFPDYNVFVGGTSSFDLAPKPFDKYYALNAYCAQNGIAHDEVVYFGDDYGIGGNDECIFKSDIRCVPVDDYREFSRIAKEF